MYENKLSEAKPVHTAAQAAITTRRPEMVKLLRGALHIQGPAVFTEDVDLLLNALELAIAEAHEAERRLQEVDLVLKSMERSLSGAANQVDRLRDVIREGGTYENAVARAGSEG